MEIFTALREGVPIVAVRVAGAFPYNFADATHFLDHFEVELERHNPGASFIVRSAGIDLSEMGSLLRQYLPSIISKPWEPSASHAVLDGQLEDIIQAMESARQQQLEVLSADLKRSTGLGEQLL